VRCRSSGRSVGGDPAADAEDRERGDGHVHQQQHLPRGDREHEAPGRRADGEPDQADRRDQRDRADAQALLVEEPEGQRDRAGRGHRGGDAHHGADRDQLLGAGDERRREARGPEQHQADEHDPAAPDPVGHGAEHQHQPAEDHGVGVGHPLQRDGGGRDLAPDRREGDREDRVVEHLDQEDRRQSGQREPRLTQGARRRAIERRSGHEHRSRREHCSCQLLGS
jgi:hypothetical protein